jgi:hypothetical protein
MATARYGDNGTGGSSTSALAAGGYTPPGNYSLTEEFTAPAPFASNVTLTAS